MPGDLRHTRAWVAAFALAGMTVLAGCSDGTAPVGGDSAVAVDAADMADASVDETELAFDALGGASDAVSMSLMAPAGDLQASPALHLHCATVSSTADTDGDGIRDDATFTYALPACSFAGWRGGIVELTGTITISDPDPAQSFAYLLRYDDFKWQYTAPNAIDSWSATRNGSRTLTATASQLSLSNQVSILRTFAHRADATVSHNTMLVFTPDDGASLVRGQPLPSGLVVKSGQVTLSRNGNSRTFSVNTVTPLRFDASCETWPRITAGEIHYELSDGSYAKVTWPGCGQRAERSWVPAS